MVGKVSRIFMIFFFICTLPVQAEIKGTKHDLSAYDNQGRVCVFCHTPHNANQPVALWNHRLSSAVYTTYPGPAVDPKSSLEKDTIQPEQGSSTKLCLSCHDGTIAIGDYNGLTEIIGTRLLSGDVLIAEGISPDSPRILSNDHPVSIELVSKTEAFDSELIDPSDNSNSKTRLENGKVECGSCHDPHNAGSGKFLRTETRGGALCLECHEQDGWVGSAHQVATQEWNYVLVSDWACLGCHKVHNATQGTRLLRPSDNSRDLLSEEEKELENDPETGPCLNCHDGQIPEVPDIRGEFHKGTRHPVQIYKGDHFPKERLIENENLIVTHVECVDCHDPHKGRHSNRSIGDDKATDMLVGVYAPEINPQLYGTAWEEPSVDNTVEYQVSHEYELCLKCHSTYSKMTFDQGEEHMQDIDVYFNPNNWATHGCIARGKNRNPYVISGLVQELKDAWEVQNLTGNNGVIACCDCHGSDSGEIDGPHGSDQPWLLRVSEVGDEAGNTIVCYRCHDPAVYGKGGSDGSRSAFPSHTVLNHWWQRTEYPPNVPEIGCLGCHGDFSREDHNGFTPGGLHGAELPRTDRPGEEESEIYTTSPIHFLNGFGISILPEDTSKLLQGGQTINCAGYVDQTTGIGCNAHLGPGTKGKEKPQKYIRPNDATPLVP